MTHIEFSHGALGRPARIASLCFPMGSLGLAEVAVLVEREAGQGVDLVTLPETFRGQADDTREELDGPSLTTLAPLARKHQTYILAPIDRVADGRRLNSAVLLDRRGEIAGCYDKVFPYWSEFDHAQPVQPGNGAPVFATDFGMLGVATCFDVNFPEVWQQLADGGAELVIWVSAYSAGSSLQAHAINHHYYIVSTTATSDCQVYDITGRRALDFSRPPVTAAHCCLDLDRGIYHRNFNDDKVLRLLNEQGDKVTVAEWLDREQWFVLQALQPGVSARALAREYGMEELRAYLQRSRVAINGMRGNR